MTMTSSCFRPSGDAPSPQDTDDAEQVTANFHMATDWVFRASSSAISEPSTHARQRSRPWQTEVASGDAPASHFEMVERRAHEIRSDVLLTGRGCPKLRVSSATAPRQTHLGRALRHLPP